MKVTDLRSYIKLLEDNDLLKRITTEVNWDGEIAAISRKILNKRGPALLFENIKDYKDTYCTKVFTNGFGNADMLKLAMGQPEGKRRDLIQTFRKAMRNNIDPEIISKENAPVKENVILSPNIDLYQLPVPKWHHLDGGRYIMTWCCEVTKDPETNWHNIGMYRGMIVNKDTISVLLLRSQHWGIHFEKYCQRREPMPVAIVYGASPLLEMAAASQIPVGVSEYNVAGALHENPLKLVKCETSDLLIPAFAEIVIEGFIDPKPENLAMEGPFGEYTGYYGGERRPRYTIKVECITYRNDPIFRGSVEGSGPNRPNENTWVYAVTSKAVMLEALERAGVPGIIDVRPGPVSFVKIKKSYAGHARQVATALWGSWASEWMWKYLIVVDEDIDIYNDRAIQWAMCYRCEPGTDDIFVMSTSRGGGLDLVGHDDVLYGTGKRGRILFDATRKLEKAKRDRWGNLKWKPQSWELSEEEEELIKKKWDEYKLGIPLED